jgi:hypothetical protein
MTLEGHTVPKFPWRHTDVQSSAVQCRSHLPLAKEHLKRGYSGFRCVFVVLFLFLRQGLVLKPKLVCNS